MCAHFVWMNLITSDPPAAKAFYSGLFGWQAEDEEADIPGFSMLQNDRGAVCGVMPLNPSHAAESFWLPFLANPEPIADVCGRIQKYGGSIVVQPVVISGVGSVAVATDPDGVLFAPFEPELHVRGDVSHAEPAFTLISNNRPAAFSFYAAISGDDGLVPFGMAPFSEWAPRPEWIVSFPLTEAAISGIEARVAELGGAIVSEPQAFRPRTLTRIAVDPTGARFGIRTPD